MLVSTQATRFGQIDAEVGNQDTETEEHIDMDLRFTAKYLVTDSTIVKFNYNFGRNTDIDQTVGTTDATIKRRRENSFGIPRNTPSAT